VPVAECGLWNPDMQFVVEPGEIELMVGSSSECISLRETFVVS
jgi:beta-glucosidase